MGYMDENFSKKAHQSESAKIARRKNNIKPRKKFTPAPHTFGICAKCGHSLISKEHIPCTIER